jgi:hypothetical protein
MTLGTEVHFPEVTVVGIAGLYAATHTLAATPAAAIMASSASPH